MQAGSKCGPSTCGYCSLFCSNSEMPRSILCCCFFLFPSPVLGVNDDLDDLG